jgi:hypothetical protein
MFRRFRESLARRQEQAILDSVYGWHAVGVQVVEICGQVLHDETIHQGDIGVSLDKADRLLFQLRNQVADSTRLLRSRSPELAAKLNQTTNKIFELRNEMARFLIRGQGPNPVSREQLDGFTRRQYHDRAMQDVGIKARELHTAAEDQLRAVWSDFQGWTVQTGIADTADSDS